MANISHTHPYMATSTHSSDSIKKTEEKNTTKEANDESSALFSFTLCTKKKQFTEEELKNDYKIYRKFLKCCEKMILLHSEKKDALPFFFNYYSYTQFENTQEIVLNLFSLLCIAIKATNRKIFQKRETSFFALIVIKHLIYNEIPAEMIFHNKSQINIYHILAYFNLDEYLPFFTISYLLLLEKNYCEEDCFDIALKHHNNNFFSFFFHQKITTLYEKKNILEFLLEKATIQNKISLLKKILEIAGKEKITLLSSLGKEKENILHVAIYTENFDVFELLLSYPPFKPFLNRKNNRGLSPLDLIDFFVKVARKKILERKKLLDLIKRGKLLALPKNTYVNAHFLKIKIGEYIKLNSKNKPPPPELLSISEEKDQDLSFELCIYANYFHSLKIIHLFYASISNMLTWDEMEESLFNKKILLSDEVKCLQLNLLFTKFIKNIYFLQNPSKFGHEKTKLPKDFNNTYIYTYLVTKLTKKEFLESYLRILSYSKAKTFLLEINGKFISLKKTKKRQFIIYDPRFIIPVEQSLSIEETSKKIEEENNFTHFSIYTNIISYQKGKKLHHFEEASPLKTKTDIVFSNNYALYKSLSNQFFNDFLDFAHSINIPHKDRIYVIESFYDHNFIAYIFERHLLLQRFYQMFKDAKENTLAKKLIKQIKFYKKLFHE